MKRRHLLVSALASIAAPVVPAIAVENDDDRLLSIEEIGLLLFRLDESVTDVQYSESERHNVPDLDGGYLKMHVWHVSGNGKEIGYCVVDAGDGRTVTRRELRQDCAIGLQRYFATWDNSVGPPFYRHGFYKGYERILLKPHKVI